LGTFQIGGQDDQHKELKDEISNIGVTSIGAEVALEYHPEELGDKGEADKLAG
jgi:hypothetical protein